MAETELNFIRNSGNQEGIQKGMEARGQEGNLYRINGILRDFRGCRMGFFTNKHTKHTKLDGFSNY
jgi:hypothetical protein